MIKYNDLAYYISDSKIEKEVYLVDYLKDKKITIKEFFKITKGIFKTLEIGKEYLITEASISFDSDKIIIRDNYKLILPINIDGNVRSKLVDLLNELYYSIESSEFIKYKGLEVIKEIINSNSNCLVKLIKYERNIKKIYFSINIMKFFNTNKTEVLEQQKIIKIIDEDGLEINLDKEVNSFGSDKRRVDNCIKNKLVSSYHFEIIKIENNIYVLDCSSTNGTFLNNKKVLSYKKKKIVNGDIIRVANIEYEVVVDEKWQ
ncbi:MAG: FHA domain-containing protein [Clostridia bacterium]|jgi:hypothetical protein|nr:FHA domain-containing protein [Clostridia bacterium]